MIIRVLSIEVCRSIRSRADVLFASSMPGAQVASVDIWKTIIG